MIQGWQRSRVRLVNVLVLGLFISLTTSAWGGVFIHWTNPAVPPASELGVRDLVVSWSGADSASLKAARKQGYRVYVEVSPQQATPAVTRGEQEGWTGIILTAPQSQRSEVENTVRDLRSAHPRLQFFILDPDGKQPEMRGSLVIKRDAVLEVSSPTAQPWIDTNLALIRIERSSVAEPRPMYTFSWNASTSGQQARKITAADYSLAVAEAGAFNADLVMELDDSLQKGLSQHDPEAWALWKQVQPYLNFSLQYAQPGLEAAANVAVVVDDLDPSDETMNLLARHNIPFQVWLSQVLNSEDMKDVDVIVCLAKPDKELAVRLGELANEGKTIVLVDAHASYPWHNHEATRLNENAVSYAVGSGKVLELSEPVSDPETFAQDIRRLTGKQNTLVSLWNGLTTIAVPYGKRGGSLKVLELINYAGDPVRVQVQVKGSFAAIRYETPEHGCCKSLPPTKHNEFTEFVIPDLAIAGRVHLENEQAPDSARSPAVNPR